MNTSQELLVENPPCSSYARLRGCSALLLAVQPYFQGPIPINIRREIVNIRVVTLL